MIKKKVQKLKRFIVGLFVLVVTLNMFSAVSMEVNAYSIPSEADFLNKLNALRSKYPNNGTYSGTYYENGTAKAWTCYGYACQMMYEVFGARFYADGLYQKKDYNMGTIYAGDFIRLDAGAGPDTHSIFVTKVTGDRVYFTDANYNNRNGIRWDASYTKTELARRFAYKVHIPGNTLTGNGADNKPSQPTLQQPTVNADSIIFQWNSCARADVYDLYVYKQSGEVQWASYAMRATQYVMPTEDLPDGTYYAAAVSKNSGAGVWTYSERVQFTVNNTRRIFLDGGAPANQPRAVVPVFGVNTGRDYEQVILYTSDFRKSTNTNCYGVELAVNSSGEIIAERAYGDTNGLEIPNGGFVISVNSRSYWMGKIAKGEYAAFNRANNTLYIYENRETYDNLTKTINRERAIGQLPWFKREGMRQVGWKMNGISISPWTTKVSADTILEAEWIPIPYGDVNDDGRISSEDALAILKNLVGIPQAFFMSDAADCNKDGVISSGDALTILKHLAGITRIQ